MKTLPAKGKESCLRFLWTHALLGLLFVGSSAAAEGNLESLSLTESGLTETLVLKLLSSVARLYRVSPRSLDENRTGNKTRVV